jgi:hypothetical protein
LRDAFVFLFLEYLLVVDQFERATNGVGPGRHARRRLRVEPLEPGDDGFDAQWFDVHGAEPVIERRPERSPGRNRRLQGRNR